MPGSLNATALGRMNREREYMDFALTLPSESGSVAATAERQPGTGPIADLHPGPAYWDRG